MQGAKFTFQHRPKHDGRGTELEIQDLRDHSKRFVDELAIAMEDKMDHFYEFDFVVKRLVHGFKRNKILYAKLEVKSGP
jgi:hypothetical protein